MSAVATLTRTEARLLSREWAAMLFAFVFPPGTLLLLAGAFGDSPDEGFGGAVPSDFYVTGYLAVPLGALALIGLPVLLATYRERDVLRRFAAFGVRTGTVVAAQALVTAGLVALAAVTVFAVAAPTYGIPPIEDPLAVSAAFVLGTATLIVLGVALGLAARTARAAQALGLLSFFPMWLLSGAAPPPDVMGETMRRVSDVLPMTYVVRALQDPWLGSGNGATNLLVLAGILILATTLSIRRFRSI